MSNPITSLVHGNLDRIKTKALRTRLLGLFSLMIGAISVFIFLFFPGAIERQALRGIQTQAESIGAMAANSVASAVWFEDVTEMENALGSAFVTEGVKKIEVADLEGMILASIGSGDQTTGGSTPREEDRSDPVETYRATTPVFFGGNQIGTVRLDLSLEGMRVEVAEARRLVLLVSLLIFMIGLGLTVAIGAHVTGPLREVAFTAEKISSGDFSSRAPTSTEDEVGQLARSFNKMVDRLQSAHEQLAVSKGQLDQVLDNLPADVVLFDPTGHFLYANPAAIGDAQEREWVLGKTSSDYVERVGMEAEVGRRTLEAIQRCVREHRLITTEQVLPGLESQERHLVRFFSPVLNSEGGVGRVIAYGLDITDLRQAEAELRETQERLLQSQKMESIGRLAGGVAHDFNNLLTTISGNADLLLMDMDDDDPAREDINEIHKAAHRASSLTQQLLAFSRKQVTQPKVINLNDRVTSIEKMLIRLIGEDVALQTQLEPDLGSIKADPGQIEQILVNLAVNSRDAMPKGGSLKIRTQNQTFDEVLEGLSDTTIPPGRYVVVSVTDTGIGMDPETLEKVFEPFFTKKGPGEGTGLGLATVYGIVRQSGGYIRVYSELGMGTTFKVFFPWVDAKAESLVTTVREATLAGGQETILVAEDQDGVRQMTQKILERCGYNILSAPGPEEALSIAASYGKHIDLLLTDVVMPGMSGPELVAELALIRPDTAVIYMSGYTDDQLQHHGVLQEDVVLIEKPFSAKGLAGTIRSVLNDRAGVPLVAQVR